jgi:hypothetical protein
MQSTHIPNMLVYSHTYTGMQARDIQRARRSGVFSERESEREREREREPALYTPVRYYMSLLTYTYW